MIQKKARCRRFCHYDFDIVSNFEIRISCLAKIVHKKQEIDG